MTPPNDDVAAPERRPAGRKEVAVLRYLRDLALGDGGFEWGGVRGWATRHEVKDSLGFLPSDILQRLRTPGWVDAADVHWPNRPRALWMFRISDEGMRALAAAESAPHPPQLPKRRDVAEKGFYLPRACVGALEILRGEMDDPTGSEHVVGETGWLDGRELGERVRWRPRFGWVHSEDVAMLVRSGLIERRQVKHGRRGATKPVYHVTPAGLEAAPLTWREPDPPRDDPPPPA